MRIPWEIIAAFAIGLTVMGLIGYLLLVPMRFLWRMAAGGVLGAAALMLVNFFGSIVGFSIAINPFTALTVGLLGLPGALLIGVLSVYI
jgi:inhibitor of the pro-sigma K processing machinery